MFRSITFVALTALSSVAIAAPPPGYCEVTICNKLSRFSLDPFSHLKDKMGEVCTPGIIGIQDAQVGKVLDSNSRWYQGSFNPTKQSVTKVREVKVCTPEPVKAGASGTK